MKQNAFYTLILFVILLGYTTCKEDAKPDIEGLYIGQTQQSLIWADPVTGFGNSDTTFTDTIEVKFVGADSVSIGLNHFLLNDLQQYFINTSTQYSYFANIKTDSDSLIIQSYNYTGVSPQEFTQTDIEFRGKKQD